jgi:carbamoyltransferase
MIGINVGRHDTGIAYLNIKSDTEYSIEVYQSERFTKRKHQGDFPFVAFKKFKNDYPEKFATLTPQDVSVNSFHTNPTKIESLYSQVSKYKDYLEMFQSEKFSTLFNPNIFQPGHHVSHAYSAWGFSPFEKAIIIVFDGCGSKKDHFIDYFNENDIGVAGEGPHFETLSVYLLDQGNITPVFKEWTRFEKAEKVDHFIGNSLGNFFSLASCRIFGTWQEAGKVMGLAAYGTPTKVHSVIEFQREIIKDSFQVFRGKQEFDSQPAVEFQKSANIASSVQNKFEEEVIELVKGLKVQFPDFENLILVGGCALNCLTNSRIIKEKYFKNIFIPPFPNDEGIAIGAVLCHAHWKGKIKFRPVSLDEVNAYLGRIPSGQTSLEEIKKYFPTFKIHPWQHTSQVLNEGHVVAIFQGPSEVGPRALGNRSILVRPDIPGIKEYLNAHIKFREEFRPYGASVIQEDVSDYFEVDKNFHAPFMTFAPRIKNNKKDYLVGVTHKDETCRIQTITEKQNVRFYKLLMMFKKLSGESVLLNTSLNIMNQPILEDIVDAKKFMDGSKINYIMINDYLLERHED